MKQYGLKIRENSILSVTYPGDNMREELKAYEGVSDFPTAFLSDNDFIAYSFKEWLISIGKSVPQDVSIVGFDNRDFGKLYHPTLTTIDLPTDYFGKMSVELLIDRIEQPARPATLIYIGGELVKRESTATLKQ